MDDSFSHKGTKMKSLEHIIREIVSKKKLKETEPTIMSGVFKEEQQLDEVLPAIAAAAVPAVAPEVGAMIGAAGAAGAAYLGSKLLKKVSGKSSYDPEAAKSNDSYATVAQRMKTLKTDIPAKQEIKPGAPPPIMTMEPPKAPEKLSADRPSWPGIIPAAKPAEAPPKQEVKVSTPAAKPITGKEVDIPATVKPATDAAAPAATKAGTQAPAIPQTKVGTQSPAIPKTADSAVTAARQATAAATGAAAGTAAKTVADTAAKTASKAETAVEPPAKPSGKFPGLPGFGGGKGKDSFHDFRHKEPVGTNIHTAKKHRMFEEKESEGTKIRKQVTNVGRPWTTDTNFSPKSKLAKQAEIKAKIIDESKKLAGVIKDTVKEKKITENDPVINGGKTVQFPQVIVNPPMKTPDSKET